MRISCDIFILLHTWIEMMMEMCSLRMIIRFLTILHCLQGIYAACEVLDASLKLKYSSSDALVIGCKNSSLVMTVGKVKTSRMHTFNHERFKCDGQTLTASIRGEKISIMEAKCISRVTCSRPTIDGVDITDTEKQLMYVEERNLLVDFANYTAGDRIHLKCAFGYGHPKSSCDEDPNAYDYDLYDAKEELPTEGTFTCKDDGKWNIESVIDCRKIVCNWTGKHTIDNGKLVGLKDGKYLLDDTIEAVCDAGFKPTEIAVCQPNGCFSKTAVSCEEIHCPRLEHYNNFENGKIVYSNQPITVNSTATFYCDPGYEKFGPDVRTCQGDGSWSDDDCVTCQRLKYARRKTFEGLLLGVTMENVVKCADQNLKEWEEKDSDKTTDRTIDVYNSLQLYLLVDVSGSITYGNFEIVIHFLNILLEKEFVGKNDNTVTDVFFRFFGRAVDDATHSMAADTNIPKALKDLMTVIQTKIETDNSKGYFPNRVLIVISDGQYNLGGDLHQDMINELHSVAETYSIFVRREESERALIDKPGFQLMRKLASRNKNEQDEHFFMIVINNFTESEGLKSIIEQMTNVTAALQLPAERAMQLCRKDRGHNSKRGHDNYGINEGKDRIQCGEFSELTKLNQHGEIDSITNADDGAWPWMVNLEDESKNHRCGATLLNENWILTAAHCKIEDGWKIYIGRLNRSNTGGNFIETSMAKTIPHPKYNARTFQYNICVVKLANPVLYNRRKPYAVPVCLYNATEFPELNYEELFKPKSRGVVTGWGKQVKDGSASTILKQLQLSILNATICEENARENMKERFNDSVNFCALGKTADNMTVHACEGDSGGPFVVKVDKLDSSKKRKPVFIQIGIVSWGYQCGTHRPGYYARLNPEIISWINNQISDK